MAQEIINIGTAANDGQGDPLRVAFQKINNNFTQLYSSGFLTYEFTTLDNTANQVIFEVPSAVFTQATFQINSANPDNNDSQNITINASISNDGTSVQWTGHSTLFINNPVTTYDMTVDGGSGNVQLMVSPLSNVTLNHLISAQIETATFTMGTPISIEDTPSMPGLAGTVLTTQNGIPLTTEQPV